MHMHSLYIRHVLQHARNDDDDVRAQRGVIG